MPRGQNMPSLKKIATTTSGTEIKATLDAAIRAFKQGIVAYEDSQEGLERFRKDSESYLTYVQATNESATQNNTSGAIPDVEAWAAHLGITRMTINRYEKRGGDWETTIANMKGIITACKKQLALAGKMPPVLAIFDLTNNSGYINASEFKLTTEAPKEGKQITMEEWEKVIDCEPEPPKLSDFKFFDTDSIEPEEPQLPTREEWKKSMEETHGAEN